MFLGVMFGFIFVELLIPYRPFGLFKQGFFTDLLWYTFAQGIILQLLLFKYLEVFYTGYRTNFLNALPIWVQCIFLVFFMDFIDYWMHRLSHAWLPMWRTHEVHHTSEELNCLSGARQHWIETVMARGIGAFILVLLGAGQTAVYVFGITDMIMGPFTHSNIKINIGPLKYLLNSPEMHRIHHSNKMEHQFSNYANKFALWDWIFGTARTPNTVEEDKLVFGIGYYYPQNFLRQLFYLFRRKNENEPSESATGMKVQTSPESIVNSMESSA